MDLLELRAICLKLHVSDGKGLVERGHVRHRKKDVKNEGRSDYVYENKDTDDNFTGTKDGISTQLHAILHRNTRILEELSAFLSKFDRWGTNFSRRNADTWCRVVLLLDVAV